MGDAIREAVISVQINSFDENLEIANEQVDELIGTTYEGSDAFDVMADTGDEAGEAIGESFESADDQVSSFVDTLDDAAVGLAAVGVAGLAFTKNSLDAAMQLEYNLANLRAVVGDQLPEVVDLFEGEVTRLHHMVTVGDLAQWALPIFAMAPGQADVVMDIVDLVNNAIIRMGGDAMSAEMAWIAVATAMGGSYDMLIKASRRLKMPLLAGERAFEIASEMSRENGPIDNLRILVDALGASTTTTLEGAEFMFDVTQNRVTSLGRAMGDFMEVAGEPFRGLWGDINYYLRIAVERMTPAGAQIGRFVGIFSAIAGTLGTIKVGAAILKKLGIATGAGSALAFGKWLLVLAGIVLVLEDIWVALKGGDSVLKEGAIGWWNLFKALGGGIDRYLVQPLRLFTESLPVWFQTIGLHFQEFFTVTLVNWVYSGVNKIIGALNTAFGWLGLDIAPLEYRAYSGAPTPIGYDVLGNPLFDLEDIYGPGNVPEPSELPSDLRQYATSEPRFELLEPDWGPFPEPESLVGGQNIELRIEPGAIQVDGAGDPDAVAQSILAELEAKVNALVARQFRGSLERQPR